MPDSDMKEINPSGNINDAQSIPPSANNKKNFPRWLTATFVVGLLIVGLLGGYGSGLGQRVAAQNTQVMGQLDEQFQLGKNALDSGNYELAKQYFDFILLKDSNFPGLQAAYVDLQLRMKVTITSVFSPTPVVSPTPDLRGDIEIYNAALQLLNSNDWDGAIANLDSLRKTNPGYRTAEVDGLYYMALRQRGVEKIAAACQEVNLQGGNNDLTLAEHFVGTGNLDAYAESLRSYARLYIIGASFWDQDWIQAQNFFSQVMTGYPNMSDSSCKSATKRWYEATIKRAELFMAAGEYCAAEEQYIAAFSISDQYNAVAYPTATEVYNQCHGGGGGGGGSGSETPTPSETPTETPTVPIPTDTP